MDGFQLRAERGAFFVGETLLRIDLIAAVIAEHGQDILDAADHTELQEDLNELVGLILRGTGRGSYSKSG